jgi:endoglycosylceramidase
VIWAAVEPQPGVYDDAYVERIVRTVDMLGRHGIVSLVDFHQDQTHERFHGEGFPTWAVQDDGLPNEPDLGFGPNYLLMPALQHSLDHFWNNDPGPGGVGLQDRYAAAWRHVALRFRDNRNVLGYDLFNEPFPGTEWPTCANPVGCPAFDAKLTRFNERIIAAIRSVDPRTLVWYEPNVIFNNGARTYSVSGGDPGAGFSFHDYCLPEPQTGSNFGCDPFDDLVFSNAVEHVGSTGDALLLTEFGATANEEYIQAIVDRADRFMVGWQWWHYCSCDDPTTSGPGDRQAIVDDPAKPPTGDNLRPGKLKVLGRPYPRLVSGTPQGWSFDAATRSFSAGYDTARADGRGRFPAYARTEIALPPRAFGDGYAVEVDGGAIVSGPGAPVLRIAACPGAAEVSVLVRPAGARFESCALPATPSLRLTVAPRLVKAGRPATLRFLVRAAGRPVRGASVRFAGRRARTDRRGRATLRLRLHRPGRRTAVASAPGHHPARATVVVRP